MNAFQKITGITYVTGKDENGDNLLLTRVAYHKWQQDDAGVVSQDGQDDGSTLFVGAIEGQKTIDALAALNDPEAKITVVMGDGVTPVDNSTK